MGIKFADIVSASSATPEKLAEVERLQALLRQVQCWNDRRCVYPSTAHTVGAIRTACVRLLEPLCSPFNDSERIARLVTYESLKGSERQKMIHRVRGMVGRWETKVDRVYRDILSVLSAANKEGFGQC